MKTYDKRLNGRTFPVLECYKGLPTRAWNFMATIVGGGKFDNYELLMNISLDEVLRQSATTNPKSTMHTLEQHFKSYGICPRFIKEFNDKIKTENKNKRIKNKFIRVEIPSSAMVTSYSYPTDMEKEEITKLIRDVYSKYFDFEQIDSILEKHNVICIDEDTIVEVI